MQFDLKYYQVEVIYWSKFYKTTDISLIQISFYSNKNKLKKSQILPLAHHVLLFF